MEQTRVRIGGVPTSTDAWDDVVNPHDGHHVARVPRCGRREVDAAVAAAADAFGTHSFAAEDRRAVLQQAASLLDQRRDEFARTITLESAKPIRLARTEAAAAVAALREQVERAESALLRRPPQDGGGFAIDVPLGVVAVVAPVTSPLAVVTTQLAAALAVGSPVVVKPATPTPVSAIRLAELFVEAGMPPHWVSVLPGRGSEVGRLLAQSPDVRMVCFSGSARVADEVRLAAAGKRVAAQVGSMPVLVEADADLPAVVEAVAQSAFGPGTHGCAPAQRVAVQRSISAEFVRRLGAAAEALQPGDPFDDRTDLAPGARSCTAEWVLDGRARVAVQGGRVVTGGRLRDGAIAATVIDVDLPLPGGDVYGPVAVVGSYDDVGEAVAAANDGRRGSAISVFSADLDKAVRAAHVLNYPQVHVNTVWGTADVTMSDPRHVLIAS